MTYIDRDLAAAPYEGSAAGQPPFQQPLQNLIRAAFGIVRRGWRKIALGAVLGLLAAAGIGYTLTPLYRASAEISIDPRRLSVLDTKSERKRQEPVFDPARVDSLMESARSDRTVRAVVTALKLADDPEFNGTRTGFLDAVKARFGAETNEPTPEERFEAAVEAVGGRFSAARVDNTFVFEARFLAETPQKAALVANGFAKAFLDEQVEANSDTSAQAAGWLKARLDEVGAQAARADSAVVAFKREHNIAVADGKSIDELALTAIGSLLTEAVGNTATAKAKLDRVEAVNAEATPDLAVADALTNEVITKLRQQYLDTNQRVADLVARFGADHPLVQRLRADGQTILGSIRSELKRIEEVYRSDLAIAESRETALRANLARQFARTSDIGQNQVKLQQLESTARTTRQAYEDYAQRYIQAVQQQSFPVSEARIITEASPPTKKFSPKRTLLMALGLVGGGLIGLFAGAAAELSDQSLRTRRDIVSAFGCHCLGYIPSALPTTRVGGRLRRGAPGRLALDHVLHNPFSIEAETLRTVKVAADLAREDEGARVIGVVSSLPDEGKTLVAANLAHLIAQNGARVLLIDGDLRKSALTEALAPDARTGIDGVLFGGAALADAVRTSANPRLDLLPARTGLAQRDGHEILGSRAMRDLLTEAERDYDYVVVDLPPILSVVDARAMAPLLDGVVLVVEWGATSREVVADALRSAPALHDRLLGIVLNKVAMPHLPRYGDQGHAYAPARIGA